MRPTIEIPELRHAAEAALRAAPRRIAAGWPVFKNGRAYIGAAFDFAGERWVVVRGPQRPTTARLLDATAAFQHAEGATYGLALLDPEEKEARHEAAPADFRRRFQTAAWHGLGIVWLETAGPGAGSWQPDEQPPAQGDLGQLAQAVEHALLAAAKPAWGKLTKSRDAEAALRPVISAVLETFGFLPQARPAWRFPAFWRNAECDGLWLRSGAAPSRVALEVKVTEDADAPLCQALDDLGQFDSVLYVRLLNEATRRGMLKRKGMHEAMARVQAKLSVRYIELPKAILGGKT